MKRRRVFFIAEAGVNHNGDRDKAFELVDIAARCGADAVKFQTFRAELLASATAPKAAYQKELTDVHEGQLEMLKRLELPQSWHQDLLSHAKDKGIEFMSTAFDMESFALLQTLDIKRYKVPSGELVNGPLLWQFARARKPLIVSTGMGTLSDVEQALAVIAHAFNTDREPSSMDEVWRGWSDPQFRASLAGQVTLLHCTSRYPTPPAEVNLAAISTLRSAFGLDVGFSDHSLGPVATISAVACGATTIEKHFTIDKALPGPDHRSSLEPDALAQLVAAVRETELSIGDGRKVPQPEEWEARRAGRQQVVAARVIAAGEVYAREDLTTARTGGGLPPTELWNLVGTRASRDFGLGEAVER